MRQETPVSNKAFNFAPTDILDAPWREFVNWLSNELDQSEFDEQTIGEFIRRELRRMENNKVLSCAK
jgi:hypothetical protein